MENSGASVSITFPSMESLNEQDLEKLLKLEEAKAVPSINQVRAPGKKTVELSNHREKSYILMTSKPRKACESREQRRQQRAECWRSGLWARAANNLLARRDWCPRPILVPK